MQPVDVFSQVWVTVYSFFSTLRPVVSYRKSTQYIKTYVTYSHKFSFIQHRKWVARLNWLNQFHPENGHWSTCTGLWNKSWIIFFTNSKSCTQFCYDEHFILASISWQGRHKSWWIVVHSCIMVSLLPSQHDCHCPAVRQWLNDNYKTICNCFEVQIPYALISLVGQHESHLACQKNVLQLSQQFYSKVHSQTWSNFKKECPCLIITQA